MTDAPVKPVVTKEEALKAPPSDPKAPTVVRYRFTKNLHPEEKVDVPGVVFARGVGRDGFKNTYGTFETKDAELAEKIRKYAEENPHKYIFEIK
jgi:hypothetical protein